jgi:hypothetical protein
MGFSHRAGIPASIAWSIRSMCVEVGDAIIHQVNVTRAEKAFGVVGGFATKLSGDALGGFQKDVSHPMKDSVGVSVHASRVNIADAARADKSYPKLLGHVASCACLF